MIIDCERGGGAAAEFPLAPVEGKEELRALKRQRKRNPGQRAIDQSQMPRHNSQKLIISIAAMGT